MGVGSQQMFYQDLSDDKLDLLIHAVLCEETDAPAPSVRVWRRIVSRVRALRKSRRYEYFEPTLRRPSLPMVSGYYLLSSPLHVL
jgi:hypothetical protein